MVGLHSFLRPAAISEQEFGNKWKLHTCEAKVEVAHASLSTPETFKAAIEPRMNARVVSIIGAEVCCLDCKDLCLLCS